MKSGRKSIGASAPVRVTVRVVIAGVLALVAVLAWSVASPSGSSPDDDFHLTSIWCAQGSRDGICDVGREKVTVDYSVVYSIAYLRDQNEIGTYPDNGPFSTARVNNIAHSYPPIYYAFMSIFANKNTNLGSLAIRAVNSLIFVLVIASLAILARRYKGAILSVASFCLIPLGIFTISGTNPSAWTIIASFLFALTAPLVMEARTRQELLIGVSVGVLGVLIGAGSRTDGGLYGVIAVVAGLLIVENRLRFNLNRLLILASIIAADIALYKLGGAAANLVSPPSTNGISFSLLARNLTQLPELWLGSFGYGKWGLGWLEVVQPAVVVAGAWGAAFALFVLGIRNMWAGKIFAILLMISALVAVPLYVLTHDGIAVGEGVQPRYLLPLLIITMMFAVMTKKNQVFRVTNVQYFFLTVSVAIANSIALHQTLRRYISGLDVGSFNLNHFVEWWWISASSAGFSLLSPMSVWICGSSAFLAALILIRPFIGQPESQENLDAHRVVKYRLL